MTASTSTVRGNGAYIASLVQEDSDYLRGLLENGQWQKGMSDGIPDRVLTIAGRTYGFYYGSGEFTNLQDQMLLLPEKERTIINAILSQYIWLEGLQEHEVIAAADLDHDDADEFIAVEWVDEWAINMLLLSTHGGAAITGPSPGTRYLEEYSWLDPEIAGGGTLEEQLQAYSDWLQSNWE